MVLRLNKALTRAKGLIKFIVRVGEALLRVRMNVEFVMFDSTSPYDAPCYLTSELSYLCNVIPLKFKISTPYGVGKIKENRDLAEKGQAKTHPTLQHTRALPSMYMVCPFESNNGPSDPHLRIKVKKPVEELDKVSVSEHDPSRELKVGHEL